MQPTPVFLPTESHGQRSLEGYSPWSCKESDRTERPALSLSWCYEENRAGTVSLFQAEVQESLLEEVVFELRPGLDRPGNRPWRGMTCPRPLSW